MDTFLSAPPPPSLSGPRVWKRPSDAQRHKRLPLPLHTAGQFPLRETHAGECICDRWPAAVDTVSVKVDAGVFKRHVLCNLISRMSPPLLGERGRAFFILSFFFKIWSIMVKGISWLLSLCLSLSGVCACVCVQSWTVKSCDKARWHCV